MFCRNLYITKVIGYKTLLSLSINNYTVAGEITCAFRVPTASSLALRPRATLTSALAVPEAIYWIGVVY